MESISDCAYFICNILDSVVCTILSILDLNFVLVNNILFFLCRVFTHILSILELFLTHLLTAIEDFAEFILEMYQGLIFIKVGFEESWKQLSSVASLALGNVMQITTKFNNSFILVMNSILNFVTMLIELLYALLCLVARSIVILLQMFPYTVIVVSSTTKNLAILFWQSTSKCLGNIGSFFAGFAVASGKYMQNKIKLLPRDAFYGLAIIALCYIIYRCHRNGMFRCPPRLIRAGRSLQTKFYSACEILVTWFWLVRPRDLNRSGTSEENDENSTNDNNHYQSEAFLEGSSNRDVSVLEKELEEQREKNACIICQDQPKSVILLPCRHMCLCEDCCTELLNRRATCPLCRRRILNPIKVFT